MGVPPAAVAWMSGLALAAALSGGARAQAPAARLTAVPEFTAVAPGERFRVAVRIVIPQGWHLGWVNPGGTGLPTTLSWSGAGVIADGPTEFPYPALYAGNRTVSHVYRGEVVLVTPLRVEAARRNGRIDLTGTLSWGMCTELVCIPQRRTVYTSVAVNERRTANASWAAVDGARRFLPRRLTPEAARATQRRDTVSLTLTGVRAWIGQATFFPLDPSRSGMAVDTRPARNGVAIAIPAALLTGATPPRLAGVLVPADAPRSPALLVDVTAEPPERRP